MTTIITMKGLINTWIFPTYLNQPLISSSLVLKSLYEVELNLSKNSPLF